MSINTPLVQQIRQIVEHRYDLGIFADAAEIHGGLVNTSFQVSISDHTKRGQFFLREYNPSIQEREIRFEHALLKHLRTSGFDLASVPIPCRDKTTFFLCRPSSPVIRNDTFWAMFEFMEGEDKYTWTDTNLTDREFISSASILAHLHHHGADFIKPAHTDRAQPPIMQFLPVLKRNFDAFAASAKDGQSSRLFKAQKNRTAAILDAGIADRKIFQGMLKVPIHCDYHPGNLKFENEKGVGLFDFDWSKIDYRLFDVALALVYFTARWRGQGAGCLRLKPFGLFLGTYQETCAGLENLTRLTPRELQALPSMLAFANLYVLNWSVTDFLENADADDNAYDTYIHHGIRLMRWIEDHGKWLREAIDDAAS